MNNFYLENLVTECVNETLLEFKKGSNLAKLVRKYRGKVDKEDGEDARDYIKRLIKKYKDDKKASRKDIRKKKGKNRSFSTYDYDEYKESNPDSSVGDASKLRSVVDQEKTDIAAVARDVFPDHTDQGAQSQLRKILNGDRKMTAQVAKKLDSMIDSNQIAVK